MASSFSQPIALRVDEFVSGVKSAVGVKIFGEDLDVLKEQADNVARVLGKLAGAADVNVEKVSGLAYLEIEADRGKWPDMASMSRISRRWWKPRSAGRRRSKVYEGQKVFGSPSASRAARNDIESVQEHPDRFLQRGAHSVRRLGEGLREGRPGADKPGNGATRIVIECNVVGRDIGGFVRRSPRENGCIPENAAPVTS